MRILILSPKPDGKSICLLGFAIADISVGLIIDFEWEKAYSLNK